MVPDPSDQKDLTGSGIVPEPGDAEAAIRSSLEESEKRLLLCARFYVLRYELASGSAALELAREIVQETFKRALESAGRYRAGFRPPLAWLKGIVVNVTRQHRDERRRHPRVYAEPHEDGGPPPGEEFDHFVRLAGLLGEVPDVEEQTARQQELDQALDVLPPQDREVLEVIIACDMDYDQIAARLGITQVAARARKHRALKHFRDVLLSRRGGR